ncbi:2-phospho-L-lactate transferase [Aestuariicella hydrocarbonica]|uniref:2-phospho-L-lactate transferase n=1 Tax=Pseudomaricurvus hydrocarbonicus TaxID=1470433 RepID=A0A9E5JS88_9GAMM|nr:2-phospho-L-lactate transferase [Aestuariicella hydrocarbonica]NHO65877.1 2-phospho-L-lactate transferase [Aestuariicella hydrocarbonica]
MSSLTGSITLLTGGAGGAKLAEGLTLLLPPEQLTIVPNIGDDDRFHGLWVSPDVDTLLYTLANDIDREQGWGLRADSYHLLARLAELGQPTWMQLGDRDIATHLIRTMLLAQGQDAQQVTTYLARQLGIDANIVLPSRATVQTRVHTALGELSMESYFVQHGAKPAVQKVEFVGEGLSQPNSACLEAIDNSQLILIAPSNPLLSIAPTLQVTGIRQSLLNSSAARVAVSPIIGGKTVKGPACEVMAACGYSPTVTGVAEFYHGLIDALVIDHADAAQVRDIERMGIKVLLTDTLMPTVASRINLAEKILSYVDVTFVQHKRRVVA